jgi:signal transduction histidine kinase
MIKPGDYLGEMAIIENQPRSASVQALEDTLLLMVPQEVFHGYFSRQPQSLVTMMKTLSNRIRRDIEIQRNDFEQVNIMVHDMKNLLTPLNLLEMLERKVPEISGHKYISCMVQARGNLITLMDRALSNARQLQSTTPIVNGSLPALVAELVESVCVVHPDIGGRGIRVELQGEVPEFPFSSLGLRRVLSNLIVNAAQASEADSVITVDLFLDNDTAVVQIIDQGQGIDQDVQEKIFHSHISTKEYGNGLGLTSCKQIIEEIHQGELSFSSEPGKGTTFTIRLPLSQDI